MNSVPVEVIAAIAAKCDFTSLKQLSLINRVFRKVIWLILKEEYYFYYDCGIDDVYHLKHVCGGLSGYRNLKTVTFTWRYIPIEMIPATITHVTFNDGITKQIMKCIPASVTHLTFGFLYNSPICNCDGMLNSKCESLIPASITHLTFGRCFTHSIDCLPATVTHLTVNDCYAQRHNIPTTVQHLTVMR